MRQELREGERQQAPGQLCSPVSQQRADGAWRSPRDRPKRSPNHINHRLTLGSSPNRPCCTPTKSLMHRSHYRILMEDQQDVIRSPASVLILWEREKKKKQKTEARVLTGRHCFLPDCWKKGLGFGQKEDWGAPPSLRRLLVQRARLTFRIWPVFHEPYVAGGDTEASKLGTIRIAWISSIQNI